MEDFTVSIISIISCKKTIAVKRFIVAYKDTKSVILFYSTMLPIRFLAVMKMKFLLFIII